MSSCKIYLIPTPISDSDLNAVLPSVLFDILKTVDIFFVENLRTSRRFLSKAGIKNISDIHFEVLDKNSDQAKLEGLINIVKDKNNVGVMSEAGCPGIADPGSNLIALAHKNNIRVIPLSGPSSIFLALMASGFNGQSFQFHGYLPIEKKDLEKRILFIEKLVYSKDQTQIFMETPYRNNQILGALLKILRAQTKLCVASNLTADDESIKTKTVKAWQKEAPDIHKKPSIFLIYK